MSRVPDVSVVVSTFNRAALLSVALDSLLTNQTGGVSHEVLAVDNNSTDATAHVIRSYIAHGHSQLRYAFEPRQGMSYARNTGIELARAPIVAFTDDDISVTPGWIATLKKALDDHPEADCVGGKVLPRWATPPPRWLTSEHWSPLALQDYGDESFYVNSSRAVCLVGANLGVRRDLFRRIGPFATHLERSVDHELFLRLWCAGGQGYYFAGLRVHANVQVERMTKTHHRLWHARHGRLYAILRAEDMECASARFFDVPAHVYRQVAHHALAWSRRVWRDPDRAFLHETELRFLLTFVLQRLGDHRASKRTHAIREVMAFARFLAARAFQRFS
jgi:glycosyltransferase involved in cell wall biosynthesis